MTFLLAGTVGLIAAGVLVGVGLGLLARRRAATLRLLLHLSLVAISLVPIAVHVRFTVQTAATFGEPAIDPIGMTPALQRTLVVTFVLLAVLFAIGAIIARVAPVFSAMVPAAAFTAYYLFVLPSMDDLPVLVPIDTTPVAWLFAWQAMLTALLAAYALAGGSSLPRTESLRGSKRTQQ